MTDAELSALEAAAKAATPGPWKVYRSSVYTASGVQVAFMPEVCSSNPAHCVTPQQVAANAAFIAAANPAAVLDLIAELRQAKEECLHHKDYIAELEQSLQVYDKRLADISKLLDIEHEDGSYAELSYIYHSVERLQGELRQARAERDWLAAMLSEACARNGSCPFTHWHCGIKQLSCSSACVQDWLAAAKEATCPKN